MNIIIHTIAAGHENTSSADYAIALGSTNTASGNYSVALGRYNNASGARSTIFGGYNNTASGEQSIAAGLLNIASAEHAIAIGSHNTAAGEHSLSIGKGAKIGAGINGSFVWRSYLSTDVATEHGKAGSAHFICGPAVGSEFRVSFGSVSSAVATSGATGYAWANSSDINLKENLVEHNYSDTLDRIMDMPIYTYNFKSVASGITSIGPVAQDFNRLFPSDKETVIKICERFNTSAIMGC